MRNAEGFTRTAMLGLLVGSGVLSGCHSQQAPPPPPQLPEVAVVTVRPESVSLTTELPGRTSPYLVAEVRPQVNGIIQSRRFEEGGDVKAGDVLYQIDPAPYQAAYDRAKASLAMAQAGVPAVRARAERNKIALASNAVSQQEYDEAVAALALAEATVALRKAEVESARIDLSYTPVAAPISGRIGRSNFTVGALVTAHQPACLATIHQLDPIYVDVSQSSAELLHLKRNLEAGKLGTNGGANRKVRLLLEDETPYPLEGELQFRDVKVDPTTGSFTLRMVFPNPKLVLLPGMYVQAIVEEGIVKDAILAPQQGISRDHKGRPVVLIVDAEGKVQPRPITIEREIGNKCLVSSGLAAGDRMIVEGLQRVRPGIPVKVVPFEASQADGLAAGKSAQSAPSAN